MEQLANNVFNTALYFEGGSMRAAYTSAVAVKLLEEGVYFNDVYGISAGSSNTVNYMSRDIRRTKESFVEFIALPQVGNWKTFLQGKGMFSAHFIYQEAGQPDGVLPYDFETFKANPGNTTLISLNRDTGEELHFTQDQMHSVDDLMIRVRASSTLPIIMPAPVVDGITCYDGGFAKGGGLAIHKLEEDGFERMVIVRTRKRGYRKEPGNSWAKWYFRKYPHLRDALLNRHVTYNQVCDQIDQMEKDGRAFVFYCDDLTLSGMERDVELLQRNYDAGYAQIERQWDDLMRFVEAGE